MSLGNDDEVSKAACEVCDLFNRLKALILDDQINKTKLWKINLNKMGASRFNNVSGSPLKKKLPFKFFVLKVSRFIFLKDCRKSMGNLEQFGQGVSH